MLAILALPLGSLTAKISFWRSAHPGWFYAALFLLSNELAQLFEDVRRIARITRPGF